MSVFSDTLIRLRKKAGLSQQELADKLGVSRSRIGMYETAKREPDFDVLKKIADVFDTTTGVLLGEASLAELVASETGNKSLMKILEQIRAGSFYDVEKPTIPEDDGLTENQRLLMQFARTVPEDKADMILRVMKSIVEAE